MNSLEIARQSAECLANLTQGDGSFRYRYDSRSGDLLGGYNILRHAGSIWAMLDIYRDIPDEKILESSQRATLYLLASSLKFYRKYTNVCICEDNAIKLGGNALSALALLSLFEITGERFLLSIARQLCQFMLDQRLEHGELVHKRYFGSGKISRFKSMYYTGEALLALLALYKMTGEEQWLDAVRDIESGLASEDYGVQEQSHWMLYSLELLSQFEASPLYFHHAEKIVRHILDHPEYLSWGRSTPIACRSEGLLAFLRMKSPETVHSNSTIRERCIRQVQYNLAKQLNFRLPDGSFIRGGNDRRNNEVRIDYIQHNISSYLHSYRLGLKI
jgi:hypothetical protein